MANPVLDSIAIESDYSASASLFSLDSISIESEFEGSSSSFSLDSISIESYWEGSVSNFSFDSFALEYSSLLQLYMKVIDRDGNAIENANINIDGSDYLTDSNGEVIISGLIYATDYLVTFTEKGRQTYQHTLNTEVSRKWVVTMNQIVPVIVTKNGTVLRTNADDPNNKVI